MDTVPLIKVDPQQNWKRFTWSGGHYSIDIPDDWEIEDRKDRIVFIAPNDAAEFSVTVYHSPASTLERFAQSRFAVDNDVLKPVVEPYSAEGTNWEAGILGEFEGTYPGDSNPTYRWNLCLKRGSTYLGITLRTHPQVIKCCRQMLEKVFDSVTVLPAKS